MLMKLRILAARWRTSLYAPKYKYSRIRLLCHLSTLFNRVKHLDGAIVECGVGTGNTLAMFASMIAAEGKGRSYYGFDTFTGLPAITPEDGNSGRWNAIGKFKASQIRLKRFLHYINIPDINPIFVKGDVRETTKEFSDKIAILHIDLDLYEGYKTSLENLYPHVIKGGIIAFDEYNDKGWPGATKAVDEWLEKTNHTLQKSEYAHKYFVIK